MKLICRFLEEIVILSDGRITTCCMDPLGENAYSSIADGDFDSWKEQFQSVFRRILDDPESMPRCAKCFASLQKDPERCGKRYVLFPDEETTEKALEASRSYPKRAVIELSSICNLKCRGCMQYRANIPGTRQAPFMDVDALKRWIRPGAHSLDKIRLYNYGETFMHPRAVEFIAFLKEAGVAVEISTNGMLLDTEEKRQGLVESGVDRLIFSIHGGSQDGAAGYMSDAFDFEKVVNIVRELVAMRDRLGTSTEFIWKYLLFEWNDSDEELARAVRLAREIGVDTMHFTLPGYPSPSRRFGTAYNTNVKLIDFTAPGLREADMAFWKGR